MEYGIWMVLSLQTDLLFRVCFSLSDHCVTCAKMSYPMLFSLFNIVSQFIETPYGRKNYKEDLIGSRIKVWWPLDRR